MEKNHFPTYDDVTRFIFEQLPLYQHIGPRALRYDLTNISELMHQLGSPHKKFKSLHIAGTNGKGTSAHLISAVFQQAGYKTALYTSPHYKDFRERIKLNGQLIPEQYVLNFFNNHYDIIVSNQPSYFELSVALAFNFFASENVDIAIIEVGLGGRLDSTNIIEPLLSLITNISLDHTQILGDNISAIAFEKAGIIKTSTPVVIGERHPESEMVFRQMAKEKEAPIYFAADICQITDVFAWNEAVLDGPFAGKNMSYALASILIFKKYYPEWKLPFAGILEAVRLFKKLTNYIGRWEVLSQHPTIIADGAHNFDAWENTIRYLEQLKFERLIFVMGFVNDKSIQDILKILPKYAFYFFCQANIPRALPAHTLLEEATLAGLKGTADYPKVSDALEAAKMQAGKNDLIFVGGSIFVVGEIL